MKKFKIKIICYTKPIHYTFVNLIKFKGALQQATDQARSECQIEATIYTSISSSERLCDYLSKP